MNIIITFKKRGGNCLHCLNVAMPLLYIDMGVSKNKGGGQIILVQVGAKSVNIEIIACRRQKMATTDTADKQRLIKKRKMMK